MSSKYTPGPWYIVRYGDGDSLVICTDEAGVHRISFMATPGCRDEQRRRQNWKQIKANARLIAAAPDYAEARTTLFEAIKHGDEAHQEWLRAAIDAHFRAADTKARGE